MYAEGEGLPQDFVKASPGSKRRTPSRWLRIQSLTGVRRTKLRLKRTTLKPPAPPVAAVGLDEKKGAREVDAVDADNLTDILNRLSQVLTPKIE
jgi:hypothetical protein